MIMASFQSRLAKRIAKENVVKQLQFSGDASSGRKRTARGADRIDLTRMTSKEAMDFIDGVDPTAQNQAKEKMNDKKNRAILKKIAEKNVNSKVVETTNIYSSNNDDSNAPLVDDPQPQNPSDTSEQRQAKDLNLRDKQQEKSNDDTTMQGDQAVSSGTSIFKTNRLTNVGFFDSPSKSPLEKSTIEKEQEGCIEKQLIQFDLDKIDDDDGKLDETRPVSVDQATQTGASFVSMCSCTKCVSILTSFEQLLIKHQLACKGKEVTVSNKNTCNQGLNISASSINIGQDETSTMEGEEKLVHLVKGCPKVMIGISKKAALESEVPDGDPRSIVHYILGCLYNTTELAQMSFDGKTKGVKKLDPDVASILQVYVKAKMDSKRFDFDKTILKSCCNEKFYAARRWVWSNRPDLVASGMVRAKLSKNLKKKDDDASTPVKKPNSRRVKRRPKYEKKKDDQSRNKDRKESRDKVKNKREQVKQREKKDGRKFEKKNKKEERKSKKMDKEKERELARPVVGNKRPKPMPAEVLAKVLKFSTSTPHNRKQKDDREEDEDIFSISDIDYETSQGSRSSSASSTRESEDSFESE